MQWHQKKVPTWITYPILFIFSFVLTGTGLFFYFPRHTEAQQGLIIGIEGTLEEIDYETCFCSLALLLKIKPTNATSQSGAQEKQYIFYYGSQILEELGVDWGDFPIPRMYLVAPYVAYQQQVLGNAINIDEFPCVEYDGESCSIEGYYPPILNIGAAPFAKQD